MSRAYWYPLYDNVTTSSELRIGNAGVAPTTITVYAKGVQIESFALDPGKTRKKVYDQNTGPLQIVSDVEPIVSSIRVLYTTTGFTSYSEMMGLPGEQLSSQYFFPWYNNVGMLSELRFTVP